MVHRNLGRFQSKVGIKELVLTSWGGCGLLHKQMSFYFSVYFEGSPPRALMPRGGDHPIFKCSHEKTVIHVHGGSCTHRFSWGLEHTQVALPQEWVLVLMGSPTVWNTLRLTPSAVGSCTHGFSWGSQRPQEWVPVLMGSLEVRNTLRLTPSGVGTCTHGFSWSSQQPWAHTLRSGFLYSWVLLRFPTPSGSHPQVALSLRRTHLYRNLQPPLKPTT